MKNQIYTEAFAYGVNAAHRLTPAQVEAHVLAIPVEQADAFLAGYSAEKRKLRFDADMDAVDMERGYCVWTKP